MATIITVSIAFATAFQYGYSSFDISPSFQADSTRVRREAIASPPSWTRYKRSRQQRTLTIDCEKEDWENGRI